MNRQMKIGLGVAGGITAVLGGIHLLARRNVAQIRQNPDPYTVAQLLQDPKGEEHWLTAVDGGKLRVRVAGEGPSTILLVHGYAMTMSTWSLMWHALQTHGYRVIAFDLRGHGQSTFGSYGLSIPHMATDILTVLDHFQVRDGVLLGHSLGGFLALHYWLNHTAVAQQQIRHLVLLSSLAGRGLDNAPQNQLQLPLLEHGIIQQIGRSATYSSLLAQTWVGDNPPASLVQAFCQQFLTQDHTPILPALHALVTQDLYPRLKHIPVPTTIVCGDKDHVTLPFHSQRMAAELPRATLIQFPNAGHLLNWERPRELVELLTGI
jgi:non-heme chloroperoxidase